MAPLSRLFRPLSNLLLKVKSTQALRIERALTKGRLNTNMRLSDSAIGRLPKGANGFPRIAKPEQVNVIDRIERINAELKLRETKAEQRAKAGRNK